MRYSDAIEKTMSATALRSGLCPTYASSLPVEGRCNGLSSTIAKSKMESKLGHATRASPAYQRAAKQKNALAITRAF
jgi:hypothetical protein